MTSDAPLPPDHGPAHAAGAAKARLRADLMTAMRERSVLRVRALRALIAALDNAEAVPAQERHERYVVHAFSDRTAEVQRLTLTHREVYGVLQREAVSRRADATKLSVLGKVVQANELLAEAAIIDGYLQRSE